MTLSDFMDRMKAVLTPQISGRGGVFSLATDKNEALTLAIRSVSAKWQVYLWMDRGESNDYQEAIHGMVEVNYRVAVCRQPGLKMDRTENALDADGEKSLINLFEIVRGLVVQIRFGTLEAGAAGRMVFTPRAGYLDGKKAMPMQRFNLGRETFAIQETDGATKGMKELLWAESEWVVKLALPIIPETETVPAEYFLCA